MALNFVKLGIFGSYFLVILSLFTLIVRSLINGSKRNGSIGLEGSWAKIGVFALLTLGSFIHTWYCEYFSSFQVGILDIGYVLTA